MGHCCISKRVINNYCTNLPFRSHSKLLFFMLLLSLIIIIAQNGGNEWFDSTKDFVDYLLIVPTPISKRTQWVYKETKTFRYRGDISKFQQFFFERNDQTPSAAMEKLEQTFEKTDFSKGEEEN